MDYLRHNLLTILILLPTIGAMLTLMVRSDRAARGTALAFTIVTFLISLLLLTTFDWHRSGPYDYESAGGTVQMVQAADWIPSLHIQYKVGLDGLSFPLVVLTTAITVLACVASWKIDTMTRGYFALLLLLESGLLGTFLSLDLFLFYVFFEATLLPMYFLIGIWGGPRREYAAIKFFLYTLLGSIGLLIAVIGIYLCSRSVHGVAGIDGGSFDLVLLARPDVQKAMLSGGMTAYAGRWFFALAMIAFLIKVPAFPVHTWLPDAHVEAPTPISMVLAALLLKMGGYGMFRVAYPLFPDAARAMWMPVAIIGVVSIIYGAMVAMGQSDFKKLVAYSSVSHMGYVVLGAAMLTTAGFNGALFMMISHGIISALMFFVVGVIYDRAHHRELARMGGLARTMPLYTGFGTVACFANLGLPGLCGFIGEVLVLLGAFAAARDGSVLRNLGASRPAILTLAAVACFGVVLTAAYMLWTIQRVWLGRERREWRGMTDVDSREIVVLLPLTALTVLLGVLPTVFVFTFTDKTVAAMMKLFL